MFPTEKSHSFDSAGGKVITSQKVHTCTDISKTIPPNNIT